MKNKQKQENLISYNQVLFLVTYKCKITGPYRHQKAYVDHGNEMKIK